MRHAGVQGRPPVRRPRGAADRSERRLSSGEALPATGNLLYGFGLFQYDLQNIEADSAFWRDTLPGATSPGLWPDMAACTERFVSEMKREIRAHPGDLTAAIAAYNARGANARAYAEIVTRFMCLAQEEIAAQGATN